MVQSDNLEGYINVTGGGNSSRFSLEEEFEQSNQDFARDARPSHTPQQAPDERAFVANPLPHEGHVTIGLRVLYALL